MGDNVKKTRLKGTATEKTCIGPCGRTLDRFKDFKPRQSRCSTHRIKGTKSNPTCAGCVKLVNSNIRQPRCVACDSKKPKAAKAVSVPSVIQPVEAVTVAPVATVAEPVAASAVTAPSEAAPVATVEAPKAEPVAVATVAEPVQRKASKPGPNLAELARAFDEEPGSETLAPL